MQIELWKFNLHDDKDLDPSAWYSGYYQTCVERDVREIVNVGDLESFGRFLRDDAPTTTPRARRAAFL